MPTQDNAGQSAGQKIAIETWMPSVIPALRTKWADTGTDLPKMSDWLALLHTAAVAPARIPRALAQLFNTPQQPIDPQKTWQTLPTLFTLTFEAMQAANNGAVSTAWHDLLQIQNRILQTAGSLAKNNGDAGDDSLTRQALYLKTITDLDKKIAVVHDANELLEEITALIQKNFGYDYVTFFALNQAQQNLDLQSAAWGEGQPDFEEKIRIPIDGQGATARAAGTGQPILVNNISKNSNFSPPKFLPNAKAQLSIPVLIDNELWGVLDIAGEQANIFTQDDRQLLQAFIGHVAVAIENVRLQKSLERYVREQKLLYESNLALGTSLDTDKVLKLMTRKTAEVLNVGACTICKIDEKASTITNLAEYVLRYPGNPPRTWRDLHQPYHLSKDPLAQRVLKTGRVVIEWRDDKDKAIWQHPAKNIETKDRWGTVLSLPLKDKQAITGVMEIYDKNPNRSFSNDDIQLGQFLATQTTLAMERAQLFEETRQRLNEVSTLYTMAQDITSTLDLQGILDSIVVSLRHVVACRGCCIFLLDPADQKLQIRAADGLKPQWKEMAKLEVGEGAAGQAVAKKQTVYIPDTTKDPNFIFFDEDVRSLMVIPLMAQGEIIGAINLDDSKPHAFGPAQEQLLTIAAAQAGIAIENARLFARVAAEQQQTQAIIQHMADGLLLINDQGVIVTSNPALATMLGMHSGEIVGQKVNSPNLHPNLASITGVTTEYARTGVLAREVTIETPRRRTLRIFSTLIINDDGKPIGQVRVVHDVTRERELEQLKEDFMSTVSHELRTPLFSIQGFVQILMEEEELEDSTRGEFLSIIQTQAVQLSEMVNNLLDASKFDEGKMKLDKKPVAMLDLIQQTLLRLRGFAHQQKVELTPDLPGSLPAIMGDKERLGQVLTNLIGNAIKFTPEGGQVTVAASNPDDKLLVEVKDTGLGIAPEIQKNIFKRYYQADNQDEETKKGSGLGLYIAKEIIKGHQGHIWVESEGIAGQGSIFRFNLPVPDSPVEL